MLAQFYEPRRKVLQTLLPRLALPSFLPKSTSFLPPFLSSFPPTDLNYLEIPSTSSSSPSSLPSFCISSFPSRMCARFLIKRRKWQSTLSKLPMLHRCDFPLYSCNFMGLISASRQPGTFPGKTKFRGDGTNLNHEIICHRRISISERMDKLSPNELLQLCGVGASVKSNVPKSVPCQNQVGFAIAPPLLRPRPPASPSRSRAFRLPRRLRGIHI